MEQIINQECIIIHFNIDYMERKIGQQMEQQKQKNGQTEGEYTYIKLQSGKDYDLRVTARDKAGNVSEVKQSTNKTKTNTAPTVSDVSVSNINSYSFTVKFKATDPEEDKLTYKLTWGTSMTSQNYDNTEYVKGEDGYIYIVAPDLQEQTGYVYRVFAYDEMDNNLFGTSDLSAAYSKVKTWCDGAGSSCSGFVTCTNCGGSGYCQHNASTVTSKVTPDTMNSWFRCGYCGSSATEDYDKIVCRTCNNCGYSIYYAGVTSRELTIPTLL